MSLLVFLVLGVVVALLARALLPDHGVDAAGTVPAVIAGSFAGGILVSLISGSPLVEVESTNLFGSLAGSLACLAIAAAAYGRADV
jgi:uncharacterized membrane protein YeaQ/YmgE (transglycosylase-associated protein family)